MPETVPIWSVSQLTSGLQNLLGTVFSQVRVCGEITNLTQSGAGHCYFSLKDAQAQISAVMWSSVRKRCEVELRDGVEVVCEGHLDVYPPRGTYQLNVSGVEAKGIGSLELAFLRLKHRLASEGLFLPEHKKPLPERIRKVGVITSPQGAAIRDFLQVLRRRWGGLDVVIYPSPVQGKGAAAQLAEGVVFLNRHAENLGIDCIALIRGGGSLEDLWEFNEEVLVRAIFTSELPVISGVGHEIDVTLCDLVADRRALTPSEAAEILSPDVSNRQTQLRQLEVRLGRAAENFLQRREQSLLAFQNHPVFRFPYRAIEEKRQILDDWETLLQRTMAARLEGIRQDLVRHAGQLESLSPLKVLSRGYSLTQRADNGQMVKNGLQLTVGDVLVTRLKRGRVVSCVKEIHPE